MLQKKTWKVLSYCEIPQEITQDHWISENNPDSYIELSITPRPEQINYDDKFEIENWIIDNYPELEGKTILIHIDY